jgi:hypothetical protein
MHFIKEIFLGKEISEGTHKKFTRYGRGTFDGPSINIKKSDDVIKVEGSIDYVGLLGEIILKNFKNFKENFSCSGKIFSKEDKKGVIEDEGGIEIVKSRKKLGSFTYEIKGLFSSEKLLRLYEKLNKDSYLLLDLNSSTDGKKKKWSLKTKKTPQKPGRTDGKFFSATLDLSALPDLVNEVAFDVKKEKFDKELKISHIYMIQELIIPEKYKENFKEARIHAKRKGEIKRVMEVDGVKEEREVEMLV